MKKLLSAILFFSLVLGISYAQEDTKEAKKTLRSATKALNEYRLSTQDNLMKIDEAKELIEKALINSELSATASPWITKGDIYTELTRRDEVQLLINPEWETQGYNTSLIAYQAYDKALSMAEKSSETKDALTGMTECITDLNNVGIKFYQAQDFMNAYQSFSAMVNIHNTLKENGEASPFDEEDKLDGTKYVTALAAMNAKLTDVALLNFEELRARNYDEPAIYESLHKIYNEKGETEKSIMLLNEGRQKYPDDTGLLFAEINYYLREGKMEELVAKLELAMEKEPDNISLYTTMGSVFDNLYQKANEDGDLDKASEYFDKSMDYFNQAVAKDENNAVAIYSIGALHYNKAALLTQELNEVSTDYSKEGTAKYEKLKAQIDGIFEEALPFFQKAESMDPNDRNTLIALKEIYARKNDLELSNEFKRRLEVLDAGGTNESSYFKNN